MTVRNPPSKFPIPGTHVFEEVDRWESHNLQLGHVVEQLTKLLEAWTNKNNLDMSFTVQRAEASTGQRSQAINNKVLRTLHLELLGESYVETTNIDMRGESPRTQATKLKANLIAAKAEIETLKGQIEKLTAVEKDEQNLIDRLKQKVRASYGDTEKSLLADFLWWLIDSHNVTFPRALPDGDGLESMVSSLRTAKEANVSVIEIVTDFLDTPVETE